MSVVAAAPLRVHLSCIKILTCLHRAEVGCISLPAPPRKAARTMAAAAAAVGRSSRSAAADGRDARQKWQLMASVQGGKEKKGCVGLGRGVRLLYWQRACVWLRRCAKKTLPPSYSSSFATSLPLPLCLIVSLCLCVSVSLCLCVCVSLCLCVGTVRVPYKANAFTHARTHALF